MALQPLYRELIEAIPQTATVESASTTGLWARVTASLDGVASIGIAYCGGPGLRAWDAAMARVAPTDPLDAPAAAGLTGRNLREVATDLIGAGTSAERALAVAAINAWYSHAGNARANRFVPTAGAGGGQAEWGQVFDPFRDVIAGKTVAVIGHHPGAPSALDSASDFHMLEIPEGLDELPPAAEFIVPRCEMVFISGSSFINGSAPRLIELAAESYCAVIGPSAPLAPALFDHGVDLVAGLVADDADGMDRALVEAAYPTIFAHGHRVHRSTPEGTSVLD